MAQPYEDAILRRNFELWDCIGTTPLWGKSRQALIGATPWFHNLQSGFANVIPPDAAGLQPACGLLVNDYGGDRNYLDTEVIIVSINSPASEAKTTTTRVRAMQEAIDHKSFVGFIVAKGATNEKDAASRSKGAPNSAPQILFPGKSISLENFEGFVLDWFLPVKMWPEVVVGQTDKYVWMVKLQKHELEKQAWWASAKHPQPPQMTARNFSTLTPLTQCKSCNQTSPEIYQEGFVCFNTQCTPGPSHLAGNPISKDEVMTYTDAFLKERCDTRAVTTNGPYTYPEFAERFGYTAPIVATWDYNLIKTEMLRLLETAVCQSCCMAVERVKWTGWTCKNTKCLSPLDLQGCPPIVSVHDATTLGRPATELFTTSNYQQYFTNKYPNFYQGVTDTPLFTIHRFRLRHDCSAALMHPKPGTNQVPDGSDHLFNRLQVLANTDPRMELLRRRTQRAFLTSHFNQNFGAPYHMTVEANETSFEQAPEEIRKAVTKANEWTNQFRSPTDNKFNEMYIAAYLMGQAMNYHQDNERGLEDLIMTWSLGGTGTFKIAVESNVCKGKASQAGAWLTDDPLVPGCRKYDERVALKQRLTNGEINQQRWSNEFQQLMKDEKGKDGREVLQLPATHGSLIVMNGVNTQTLYQHRMDVVGPMRFALTFRYIGAANQAPKSKRSQTKRKADDQGGPPADDDHSKSSKGAPGNKDIPRRGRSTKKSREGGGAETKGTSVSASTRRSTRKT